MTTTAKRDIAKVTPIPPEVAAVMGTDTAFMGLGCSGFLIRDGDGVAVGVLTAEHCLTGRNAERIPGSDGREYIVAGSSMEVFTGGDRQHLVDSGTIKEFYVPGATDRNLDVAFGVFAGHTVNEVLGWYAHLAVAEASALPKASTIYMAGWPESRDGTHTIAPRRQEFAMSVLGTGVATSLQGEMIDIVWATSTNTADGFGCSKGSSGSAGLVSSGAGVRAVGAFSIFQDVALGSTYSPPDAVTYNRQYFQTKYDVTLPDNITSICGFAYFLPTPENGGVTVEVVSSPEEIPGYRPIYAPTTTTSHPTEVL